MKFLLDQGLPRGAAGILTALGHDTAHSADVAGPEAPDSVLLELAVKESRVVVTLDADFHQLLSLSRATSPSVVRIRLEGLTAKPLAALLVRVAQSCHEELTAGAAASVEVGRVRLRMLPIGG